MRLHSCSAVPIKPLIFDSDKVAPCHLWPDSLIGENTRLIIVEMKVQILIGPPFNEVSMFFNKLIEIIKEWFKPAKDTCKVYKIISADDFNYIKEKCAKEGVPMSGVFMNLIKQGYKFDIRLRSEILEILQKESLVHIILV